MVQPYKNVVPTPFLQAKFCSEVYNGAHDAVAVFNQNGFELKESYDGGDKDLPFHMYIPTYFPANRDVVENGYDWSRVPKELPVGFVARGTEPNVVSNLKEDMQLLKEMVKSESCASESAQQNCSHVLQRLNGFLEEYPEMKENGIRLKVYIAGHSLGGFQAAVITVFLKNWADNTGSKIICTTFESPGLTRYYWGIAKQQMGADKWKGLITNYVSLPNPINTAHKHLGKIVFLEVFLDRMTCTWALRCAQHSLSRAAAFGSIAMRTGLIPTVVVNALKKMECLDWVGKATELLTFASFLSVEIAEIADQHKIRNMKQCFTIESPGLPRLELAHEMKSWPHLQSIEKQLKHWTKQSAKFLVPFHPDNIGVHTMCDRRGVIWRRLIKLEGFVTAD